MTSETATEHNYVFPARVSGVLPLARRAIISKEKLLLLEPTSILFHLNGVMDT
jgi:hypothetical protein